MGRPSRYAPEVPERAVRLVLKHERAHDSQWATIRSPHVKADMAYALGSKSYKNRLIPVTVGGPEQLPKSEISWIVRKLHWVDLPSPEIGDPEVKPIADALPGQGRASVGMR